jgi:hypothetical protein
MNDWYCMGIKLLSYVAVSVEYMVWRFAARVSTSMTTETALRPLELYKSLVVWTVACSEAAQ